MLCDALHNVIGHQVSVFLSSNNRDTGLNGKLLEVGQDYIVITGKQNPNKSPNGYKIYIPIHSILSIADFSE